MNLTEVDHKSLAGINKLPADLWWTWLKLITNHWLGLTSCQLICDEPAWSSSQITGWDWKVASWFAMNLSQVHRKSFDLFWERFCDEKVVNWFVMKSFLLNLDFKDILESKTHTRTSLFTSHCVSSESRFVRQKLPTDLSWISVRFATNHTFDCGSVLWTSFETRQPTFSKFLISNYFSIPTSFCSLLLGTAEKQCWCFSPYSSFWSLEWAMSWPWRQCYTASIYLKPTFSDCEETLKNWICQKKLHRMFSWTISLAAAFLLTHSSDRCTKRSNPQSLSQPYLHSVSANTQCEGFQEGGAQPKWICAMNKRIGHTDRSYQVPNGP